MDIFLQNIKNNILFKNPYIYKDFLPVKIFVKILAKLIASKCSGIYNVSFGKKIYIDNILNWLNYYNNKPFIKKVFKINGIKENKDCFYLNNTKLKKKIKFNLTKKILELECKKISKKIFYEK